MKKRILAALVAVAMVFGIFTVANADWVQKEGTEAIVSWDFEDFTPQGGGYGYEWSVDEGNGVDGSKCLTSPNGGGWQALPLGNALFTAEAGKDYVVSIWAKGAVYKLGFWFGNTNNPQIGEASNDICYVDPAWPDIPWTELKFHIRVEENTVIGITGQESGRPVSIDNVTVYEAEEGTVTEPTDEPIVDVPAGPVKADDFEGTQVVTLKEWWGTAGESTIAEVDGPNGETTKVWQLINNSWGVGNMGTVLSGLDPEKTYKFSAWVKGDWAYLDLRNSAIPDDPATEDVNESSFDKLSTLSADWKLVESVFTGVASVDMVFQIQSADGYYNGTAYMDDFLVVEYDPSAEPTVEPTVEPTAPVVDGTVEPTAPVVETTPPVIETPPVTEEPEVKKSVKFVKKTVKLKKGKKATLKVKIKGAKKAKFSVDKKSKKIIKVLKTKKTSITVKGKKKGTAKVVAKVGKKKATCKVKVK